MSKEGYDPLTDAADLVLAMMSSASTERIRPIDWWVRAQSALEAAASSADDIAGMVSVMARKLEIYGMRETTSHTVVALAQRVTGSELDDLREACSAKSPYIIALARVLREDRKEGYYDDNR